MYANSMSEVRAVLLSHKVYRNNLIRKLMANKCGTDPHPTGSYPKHAPLMLFDRRICISSLKTVGMCKIGGNLKSATSKRFKPRESFHKPCEPLVTRPTEERLKS